MILRTLRKTAQTAVMFVALNSLVMGGSNAEAKGLSFEKDPFKVTVHAQLRPRLLGETGRKFRGGDLATTILTQRSLLGATIAHAGGVAVKITFQDTRIWGEDLSVPLPLRYENAKLFSIREAYADLPFFDKALTLRFGRQDVNWDNQRLLGAVDWLNRGAPINALRLMFKKGKFGAEVLGSKLIESERFIDGSVPEGRTDDVDLFGARMQYGFSPAFWFSLSHLALYRKGPAPSWQTFGGNVWGNGIGGGLAYRGEFFAQVSPDNDAIDSEFLGAINLAYTLKSAPMSPTISAWAEFISGGFQQPFGTNHKFYGELDFFLNIPANSQGLGLNDFGGGIALWLAKWEGPTKGVKFMANYHMLTSQESDARDNNVWGHEIDTKLIFWPLPLVSIRAFYGILLPENLARVMRGKTAAEQAGALEAEHRFYITTDIKI